MLPFFIHSHEEKKGREEGVGIPTWPSWYWYRDRKGFNMFGFIILLSLNPRGARPAGDFENSGEWKEELSSCNSCALLLGWLVVIHRLNR